MNDRELRERQEHLRTLLQYHEAAECPQYSRETNEREKVKSELKTIAEELKRRTKQ